MLLVPFSSLGAYKERIHCEHDHLKEGFVLGAPRIKVRSDFLVALEESLAWMATKQLGYVILSAMKLLVLRLAAWGSLVGNPIAVYSFIVDQNLADALPNRVILFLILASLLYGLIWWAFLLTMADMAGRLEAISSMIERTATFLENAYVREEVQRKMSLRRDEALYDEAANWADRRKAEKDGAGE